MLFLRSWLEEFIDLSGYSNEELRTVITKKSSEVEEIKQVGDYFEGRVVVAQVTNLRKHPDADRLQVFDAKIDGNKSVQIISAASNLREEMLIPLATVGAVLPDLTISARLMRGQESNGMVCGKSEILLEDGYSSDVWDLEREFTDSGTPVVLGQSICEAFPEYFPRETLMDIKVLPNRVGVFGSYLGMAIELAMIIEDWELLKPIAKRLLNPNELIKKITSEFESKTETKYTFDDKSGYTNDFCLFDMELDGPVGLDKLSKKRMFLTGTNLVGGLTDFSNYLMMELGQPTHFFSKNKLIEKNVNGFAVEVLDQPTVFKGLGNLKKKNLPIGTRVLTGNGEVLAIPAISGGDSTKMDMDEKSVVVEIANFDREEVARNSFLLKYRSQGTKFWAGGVNSLLIPVTLLRLREIFGDKLTVNCVWNKSMGQIDNLAELFNTAARHRININIEEIANSIDGRGLEYWTNIIKSKLNVIGQYNDGELLIEPFYSNLTTKQDVIEEVIRLVGFDDMITEPIVSYSDSKISDNYNRFRDLKQVFVDFGLSEVILRPFVSQDNLLLGQNPIEVVKSYNSNEPFLRDSLLASLMVSMSNNIKSGEKEPKIFENNKIHFYDNNLITDKIFIDGLICSKDPYLSTSLVHGILNSIDDSNPEIIEVEENFGKGYVYKKGSVEIKLIQISNKLKKKYDIALTKTLWWVSVDLTSFDGKLNTYNKYIDESNYPQINRTYSLLIDKKLKWETISQAIKSIGINDSDVYVKSIERFADSGGQDVINFEINFVSFIRTLDSKEIEEFEQTMIENLSKDFSVSTR